MKKIYISYAHAGEGKQVTESLDKAFQARDVRIVRDVRDVAYKESFGKFMTELGAGDYVIAVIDKPYLESENCMGELMEVYKNEQFRKRIFPVVLSDAGIYKPRKRIKYIAYWENEIKELEDDMRSIGLANTKSIQKDLDLYTEIRRTFDRIIEVLADMNTYKLESHQEENFKTVFEAIHGEISKNGGTTPPPDSAPSVAPEVIAALKKNIQTDIGKNRIKEAIAQLTAFANEHKPDLVPISTGIQQGFDEIQKQKIRGTLTFSEVSVETNKITGRIFDVFDLL